MKIYRIGLFTAAVGFVILGAMNLYASGWFTPKYVTNPARQDGFGAQLQGIIGYAVLAEMTGAKFVYTPFTSMEHNYINDPGFLSSKEKLINFVGNFPTVDQYPGLISPVLGTEWYCDNQIQQCAKSKILKKIKTVFRANKNPDYFANGKFNIALHIRRPNSHDTRLAGADVPDQTFLNIMQSLQQQYIGKDYILHIYSQGAAKSFVRFQQDKVQLHLNESIEDTFTALVYADVLVTSPSSFSYTAGLLSNGEVYYMPFWHPPLPGWKILMLSKNLSAANNIPFYITAL
jgi:hypothetical protein